MIQCVFSHLVCTSLVKNGPLQILVKCAAAMKPHHEFLCLIYVCVGHLCKHTPRQADSVDGNIFI